MITSALLVSIAFLIVNGVDRLMSWQTFARPIVTSTVTGLVLGDMETGIIMGASLEAIFMGISAIGGSLPADPMASSIVAVAFTVLSGTDIEAGLALAMPIGTIMASVNELYKPILASFAPHFENLAAKGKVKQLRTEMVIFAVFIDKLPQLIIMFLAVAFGIGGLESVMASLPAWVMAGFSAAASMMTGVGFAILTSMIWNKEICGFFFVGFVLSKYLGLGTLPIAILAAVVAMMYFYNDKKILSMKQTDTTTATLEADDEEDFF